MNAYGLVIAVWMHSCSVAPRIGLEAALAQSVRRRASRSGPIGPVAPAAASVWQEEQPAEVNTAFPSAVLLALDELDDELLLVVGAAADPDPGTPTWTPFAGGTPIGGGPLGFWERNHVWNCAGVTTCAAVR